MAFSLGRTAESCFAHFHSNLQAQSCRKIRNMICCLYFCGGWHCPATCPAHTARNTQREHIKSTMEHRIGDNLRPTKPRTHEENRALVCVLCLNERGEKAIRKIRNVHPREKEPDGWKFKHLSEENLIQKWLPGYNSANPLMPCGLCKWCIFLVSKFHDGQDVDHLLLLPEDIRCKGYHPPTRSVENVICQCNFCKLARMYGGQFNAWRR